MKPVVDDSLVFWVDGSTGNNYQKTSTWKDLSGKGNHGELVGFTFGGDNGWEDDSLLFNGDTHVICGNDGSLDITEDLTLEMWVNIPSDGHVGGLVKGWSGGWATNSYGLRAMSGYYRFYLAKEGEGAIANVNITIPNDELVHVVGTTSKQGNFIKGYRNGELIASTAREFDYIQSTTKELYVGVAHSGAKTIGNIYIARIYNRALTDKEVLQNYEAGQPSPLLIMEGM